MFTIVSEPFEMEPVTFERADLERLGDVAIKAEAERVALAINVNDQPAKPLTKGYQARKIRAGKKPIRNMDFTGDLLASRVAEVDETGVSVGFRSEAEEKIAGFANTPDPMLGMSPEDERAVDAAFDEMFAGKF